MPALTTTRRARVSDSRLMEAAILAVPSGQVNRTPPGTLHEEPGKSIIVFMPDPLKRFPRTILGKFKVRPMKAGDEAAPMKRAA